MLCVKHGERDCVYQEYRACRESQRDDLTVMQKQIERYQREGMPPDLGLIVGSFIYRRHHDPAVIRVMNRWWTNSPTTASATSSALPTAAGKSVSTTTCTTPTIWSNDYFLWLPTGSRAIRSISSTTASS
jgi:hypothetical protein